MMKKLFQPRKEGKGGTFLCTLTIFSCTAHATKQHLVMLRQGVDRQILADYRLIEVCRASRLKVLRGVAEI